MSTLSQYAGILFGDRVKVLGKTLRPYCIGHALLLHLLDSPYVSKGKRGDGDLLAAIYVCSRPWQEAAVGLKRKRTKWMLKLWDWQTGRFKTGYEMDVASLVFQGYLNNAWTGPQSWEDMEVNETANGNSAGAPAVLVLKVALCSFLGASHEEALSTPIRQALHEMPTWLEVNGANNLMSDGDVADIENLLARQ